MLLYVNDVTTRSARSCKRNRVVNELLKLAIDAHGGMERWERVSQVEVVLTISGGLWRMKGYPQGLPNVTMTFDARTPKARIASYLQPAHVGHFEADRVWIADADGRVLQDRSKPRAALASNPREHPWDDLHQLYFAGAGFWNYFTTPFLLARADVETAEIEPHIENGETWRRLKVKFPPGFPTHSEEQTFYFNQKGLLQRLDYVTVEGGTAAHYCFDLKAFGGLVFPTLRRVVPRTPKGAMVSGPTVVLVTVAGVTVS